MSKHKVKFNFLDVLLILTLIALLAGVIWRRELSDRLKTENIENTVILCCEIEAFSGGEDSHAVEFDEGVAAVYADGAEVGYMETLFSESPVSADESGETSGEAASAQTVKRTRLYLNAVSRASGYYINGEIKLLENVEYRLNTKTVEFTARILSVKEKPKD